MGRHQSVAGLIAIGLALSGSSGIARAADTWAWYRANQRVPLMRFDLENGFRRGSDLGGGAIGDHTGAVDLARAVGARAFEYGLTIQAERQIEAMTEKADVREALDRGEAVVFYVDRVEQKGGENGETITVQDAPRVIGTGQDLSEALDKYVIQTSPPDGGAGLSAPRPNADFFAGYNSSVTFVVSKSSSGKLTITKQYNYGLPSRSSALSRQKFRALMRSGWVPFKPAFPAGHLIEPLGNPAGPQVSRPQPSERIGRGESPRLDPDRRERGGGGASPAPSEPREGGSPAAPPDVPSEPKKPDPPPKPDNGDGPPGPIIRRT